MRRILAVAGAVVAVLVPAVPVTAADGVVDPSFGASGLVTAPLPGYDAVAVARLPDGRIVVAARDEEGRRAAALRFATSGTPDTTFSADGIAGVAFTGFLPNAVAATDDGGVVLAGASEARAAIASFDPTGRLAATQVVDLPGDGDQFAGVAVDDEGRIVAVGGGFLSSPVGSVARFLADGRVDPSFDEDGIAPVDLGTDAFAVAVVLDGAAPVVVALTGYARGQGDRAAVVRLSADGARDQTFGVGGRADFGTVAFTAGHDIDLARDGDGRLVVAAETLDSGSRFRATLRRFSAAGQLDPSFSVDEPLITAGRISAVTVDADDRVLLTQTSGIGPSTVQRFDDAGRFDAGFGCAGTVAVPALAELVHAVDTPAGLVLVGDARGGPSIVRLREAPPGEPGVWLVTEHGHVHAFGGGADPCPSVPVDAAVAVAGAATRNGFLVTTAFGDVDTGGGAVRHGALTGRRLAAPVVGMAVDPDGDGYWLVAADGGVFTFGDAAYLGSMGGRRLAQPIVGIAVTRTGRGYFLVAADGGVFTFGDARFRGSTGGRRLAQPVVGMATDPDGDGYWLVARDGGVFSFGGAVYAGSTGDRRLNAPVVGMAADPDGDGYWLAAADGGVFAFRAPFVGSLGARPPAVPVVAVASASP